MSALAFALPPAQEAHEPPEARGVARDGVRLLVSTRQRGELDHARFHDLPDLLAEGDVLVVNTSATLAAAIGARRDDGRALRVHFSTPVPPGPAGGADRGAGEPWVVELRSEDGTLPRRDGAPGQELVLDGGARLELRMAHGSGGRLWRARFHDELPVVAYLARHGRAIRYRHGAADVPLEAHQTVFARTPGSAEMPSAGRPFTPALVPRLLARGVHLAPVTLHAGVSSLERHERPYAERYVVPPATARLLAAVRGDGGRVIAVGTTVVRALETVAGPGGRLTPSRGWTSLVIGPERPPRVVDGLVTGFHEPDASHLEMLEAIAGPELLARSYAAALDAGYRWHEFGDSHLILP